MKIVLTLTLVLVTLSLAVPVLPAQGHSVDPSTYARIDEVTADHGIDCTCGESTDDCTGDCTHCTCDAHMAEEATDECTTTEETPAE